MKLLLASVTLAPTALVLEEKARQVAGDVHDAYGEAAVQAREANQTLAQQVEQHPLISLLIARGLPTPRRRSSQAAARPETRRYLNRKDHPACPSSPGLS